MRYPNGSISGSLLALVVATTLPGLACGGDRSPRPIVVGKAAPAYAAVTLAGAPVTLAGLKGQVVLLNVWATWCDPCRIEIPYLEQLHNENGSKGLTIIGVSVDANGEQQKIAAFAKEMGMTYTLWHDPDERVLSTFLSIGVPASYLIDRQGNVQWKHVGVLRPTNAAFTSALASALGRVAAAGGVTIPSSPAAPSSP